MCTSGTDEFQVYLHEYGWILRSKEPTENLTLRLSFYHDRQAGSRDDAYHRTLGTTVLEAAAGFFVEAVVGSGGFGHFLHDGFRFHILLCSGVYCDMGPLENTMKSELMLILRPTGKYF